MRPLRRRWGLSLEVVRVLKGALPAGEELEAGREGEPLSVEDGQLAVGSILELIRRQGAVLCELAEVERTRSELEARLTGAIERVPAFVQQGVDGVPLTSDAFMGGLAEVLALHREAFQRVVAEQVASPGEIEELLALAPVPAQGEHQLADAVSRVIGAHSEALALIAHDLEPLSEG